MVRNVLTHCPIFLNGRRGDSMESLTCPPAVSPWLVMRHSIDAGSLHAQKSWQTKLQAAKILELDRDATHIRDKIDVREQR